MTTVAIDPTNLTDRVAAVLIAAAAWRTVRRDQNVSGMVRHHAAKALDEAVAYLAGELDRQPLAPPTGEEIEHGREVVRQATAYAERMRAAAEPTTKEH